MRYLLSILLAHFILAPLAVAQDIDRYARPSDSVLDAITVNLYFEEMAVVRQNLNDRSAFKASVENDLKIYANCIAYNKWYDVRFPGNVNYRNNAMDLKAHFGFIAEAMERHGLESAEEAKASLAESQAQLDAEVTKLFSAEKDDTVAKAKMSKFHDICYDAMGPPIRMDKAAIARRDQINSTSEPAGK